MSINSMTNAAIGRRADFHPIGDVPKGTRGIAEAAGNPVIASSPITDQLAVITTYIPTEVLTVYVAALAALENGEAISKLGMWIAFGIFLFLTPLAVWSIYAAKIKLSGKPIPTKFVCWPLWEMSAGTLAFLAWAIALPSAPFLEYLGMPGTLATLILLVTTTLLGWLAPLFQNPLNPS